MSYPLVLVSLCFLSVLCFSVQSQFPQKNECIIKDVRYVYLGSDLYSNQASRCCQYLKVHVPVKSWEAVDFSQPTSGIQHCDFKIIFPDYPTQGQSIIRIIGKLENACPLGFCQRSQECNDGYCVRKN